MKKNRYRHRVEILRRRQSAAGSGGYGADEYEKIGEASCEIRDESEGEYAAAESARIEHVCDAGAGDLQRRSAALEG